VGTRLVIEVIAANRVGKVETLTIRSGAQPTLNHLCLPPGTSQPARCA
jgi:hypothetical protein